MPNSTLYAFILSFFAGISTILGALIIFIKKDSKIITPALSFAAGVMICVSITDLIPSCYISILNTTNIFPKVILTLIFIVIGIIISMLIDKYLPSEYEYKKDNKNNDLYKIGIISMVAIIIHNVPEGIATFITSSNNIKLGIVLTIAIALHNIPEGICIAVPIYHSTKSKLRAILYAFISGMSEVIGSIISYLFLAPYINDYIMAALYAIIGGIMIHISVYELIPEAYDKGTLKEVLKYLLIGIIIMLLSRLIM